MGKGVRRFKITAWGETKSLLDWLDDRRVLVKNYFVVRKRIKYLKWTPERAFTQPNRLKTMHL